MIRTCAIIFLFLLAGLTGHAQQQKTIQITNDVQLEKMLREKLKQSKPDTNRVRLLIRLGDNFRDRTHDGPQIDSAFKYYNIALDISTGLGQVALQNEVSKCLIHCHYAKKDIKTCLDMQDKLLAFYQHTHDLYNEADAWQCRSMYLDNVNEAHADFEKAAKLFQKGKYKIDEIKTIQYWGAFLESIGKNDSAMVVLKEALRQYQSVNYTKLYELYDQLATVCDMKGNTSDELNYCIEAVKSMEDAGDMELADRYYNRLAAAYSKNFKPERCLFYAKKTISYGRRRSLFPAVSWATKSLISLKKPEEAITLLENVLKNDTPITITEKTIVNVVFAGAYTAQKKYDKAEKYYLRSIDMYSATKFQSKRDAYIEIQNKVQPYTSIVNFYILTNQYSKADHYLKELPESEDKNLRAQSLLLIDRLRFKVDSGLGRYQSAIQHLEKYGTLNDSLSSVKNAKAVAEIDVKYETAKKEHSIKMLEDERNIRNIKTQNAVLQRNVTLAGILVAIILSGFLYNSYRRKRLVSLLVTEKNDQLQALLTEKEWLLKEVHHRVKNNLHTVICLLESQAAYLEDDALKAIESSQHRIFAMSLIHQRLYQSTDIQTIDMAVYLPEFIMYLQDSFGAPANIIFQQEIEPLTLDVAQAIPLALIVNESVTNAIKYAFPGDKAGVIKISLLPQGDRVRLAIEDNGVGIAGDIEPDKLSSLGMALIRGLTDDLKGDIQLLTGNGTSVIVTFKKEIFSNR